MAQPPEALPPHPLDDVIGRNKPEYAELVAFGLVRSDEFLAVVQKAFDESDELDEGKVGPHFGQQVRLSIGKQLAPPPQYGGMPKS